MEYTTQKFDKFLFFHFTKDKFAKSINCASNNTQMIHYPILISMMLVGINPYSTNASDYETLEQTYKRIYGNPEPVQIADNAPNILLITSDQQHWMAIGYNNPKIKTSNLDRLAAMGIIFDRASIATVFSLWPGYLSSYKYCKPDNKSIA